MAKYNNVWPEFWRGDRVTWTDQEKLLALYLLTCEHRNLEGYYHLPKGYIQTDLSWAPADVDERLGRLEGYGFCRYDETARVVFVVNALEHQLAAARKSERQIQGAVTAIGRVPASPLLGEFMKVCAKHQPVLADAIRMGSQTLPEPIAGDGVEPVDGLPIPIASRVGATPSSSSSPTTTPEDDDEAREARRTKISEVCGMLARDAPFLTVDDASVLLAVERGERMDLPAADLTALTIDAARGYEQTGTLRTRSASRLMNSILNRRATNSAEQLRVAGARAVAEAEGRSRPAPRRSSAADEIARRERAADEQLAREAAEQAGRAA